MKPMVLPEIETKYTDRFLDKDLFFRRSRGSIYLTEKFEKMIVKLVG